MGYQLCGTCRRVRGALSYLLCTATDFHFEVPVLLRGNQLVLCYLIQTNAVEEVSNIHCNSTSNNGTKVMSMIGAIV